MTIPKVGSTWRHNKRQSEYQVLFAWPLYHSLKDNDRGVLTGINDGSGIYFTLRREDEEPQPLLWCEDVVMQISLTFQQSVEERSSSYVLIYQSLADGKIWARHADEFTPDRFTEIV